MTLQLGSHSVGAAKSKRAGFKYLYSDFRKTRQHVLHIAERCYLAHAYLVSEKPFHALEERHTKRQAPDGAFCELAMQRYVLNNYKLPLLSIMSQSWVGPQPPSDETGAAGTLSVTFQRQCIGANFRSQSATTGKSNGAISAFAGQHRHTAAC